MKAFLRFVLRQWPLCAAVVSVAMLAIAHAFEQFGGLDPCVLCLRQREVYWTALAIGIAGFVLQRVPGRPWLVRLSCVALAITFAVGVGVAAYHAGVEWKWWPGPQACAAAGGAASVGDNTAVFGGAAKVRAPSCDEAVWIFLGLSMAGWNAAVSLVLAGFSVCAAMCRPWLAPKDDVA